MTGAKDKMSPASTAEQVARTARVMPGSAVDPVKIANDHGIQVYEVEFDDSKFAGTFERSKDAAKIYVNSSLPSNYKRFVIAKELYHALSDTDRSGAGDDAPTVITTVAPGPDVSSAQESQSSEFATALLMPSDAVEQVWPSVRNADGIAKWFQVPTEASLPRLISLGLLKR
jgi:Zn-dependent peptidase ImmA (M78 family)